MNLDQANAAHRIAAALRKWHAPGHEDSIAHLVELAEHVESLARRNDVTDDETHHWAVHLDTLIRVVEIGLANDRIARAAGYSDSEGGQCD